MGFSIVYQTLLAWMVATAYYQAATFQAAPVRSIVHGCLWWQRWRWRLRTLTYGRKEADSMHVSEQGASKRQARFLLDLKDGETGVIRANGDPQVDRDGALFRLARRDVPQPQS